jgi:FkbM family methyltransferase
MSGPVSVKIKNTVPNQVDKNIADLKQSDLPVYFYGAGIAGKNIKKLLEDNYINIDSIVVDDNSCIQGHKQGLDIEGKPVYPLSGVLASDVSVNIVVADCDYCEKIGNMSKHNFFIFDGTHIVSPFPDYYDYVTKNISGFEKLYNQLADELSKKILVEFINAKISSNPQKLSALNVKNEKQYFPSLFEMGENEVLIDCGAYDGDISLFFAKQIKPEVIYAFECDTEIFLKLKRNTSHLHNIHIFEKGCWSRKAILSFTNCGTMASKIDSDGQIKIEADSIDNIVQDAATFIKMDVEGAEFEALKGARNTILKYTPKLAISVYHLKEDLISIPHYILSLNDKYELYLRHYESFSSELILYAKPKQGKS